MPDQFDDFNEEKEYFSWTGPERAFQRKDRDFWITAIAILVLFAVILVFIKEFFLIVTLCSVLFLYYVLSTVPPQDIKNKITNRGLYFGEAFYPWADLHRFWFKKLLSSQVLAIETKLRFPRQIDVVINPEEQEKIKEIVVKRIPFLEESPTFIDKFSKWFATRLPLEKRNTDKTQ